MPVPSYNVIADSEIDPESPITSSLMFRLRDNVLAILSIDPADPAPVFTIPPSRQAVESALVPSVGFSKNATVTGAEIIVSAVADDVEEHEVVYGVISGVQDHGGGLEVNFEGMFYHIEVPYASGSPLSVIIRGRLGATTSYGGGVSVSGSLAGSITTIKDATIKLTNTWQTLVQYKISSDITYLEAKARADSNYVYLQLRTCTPNITSMSGSANLVVVRKSFKSKAAP